MKTIHVTLVDWTKAILNDSNDLRCQTKHVPLNIFAADQGEVQEVLRLLEEAEALLKSYRTPEARCTYQAAARLAQKHRLTFMSALVYSQYALSLYAHEDVIAQLQEAAYFCDYGLFQWQERLLEMAAPPEVAAPILNVQEELQSVVLHNLEQYELLRASKLLRTRRHVIEELLGEHEFDRAEYYAQSALKEAHKVGAGHWWTAVILELLARSQMEQRKFAQALRNIDAAEQILLEYCIDNDSPLASEARGLVYMRQAALNPLP